MLGICGREAEMSLLEGDGGWKKRREGIRGEKG
jgi:hypothetical protein